MLRISMAFAALTASIGVASSTELTLPKKMQSVNEPKPPVTEVKRGANEQGPSEKIRQTGAL